MIRIHLRVVRRQQHEGPAKWKARAAIEKEEEQQATPAPIAAEVMPPAPQARQPPDTQVTSADTEMVAEEGPDSYAPDAQDPPALPLPHANGTMPKARSAGLGPVLNAAALRSLCPAIRKSRRSKK